MKSMKFTFLSLLAVAFLTFSCKSDDDGNETEDIFNINGITGVLTEGYLISYGEDFEGVYDWDIILVSDGITVNSSADIQGTGSLIYLDLLTDSMTGVPEGTYSFSNEGAFSVNSVEAIANTDINTVGESDVSFANNGTVIVEGTGANRTITVALTGSNNTTIGAVFSGNLQIIE